MRAETYPDGAVGVDGDPMRDGGAARRPPRRSARGGVGRMAPAHIAWRVAEGEAQRLPPHS